MWHAERMDALMLLNTEESRTATKEIVPALDRLVRRARATGGVVVILSTDGRVAEAPAAEDEAEIVDFEDGEEEDLPEGPQPDSIVGVTLDDLGLVTSTPDAFDGIDDLAAGLHDTAVDRLVFLGVDVDHAVYSTAMAGLALNFDVIICTDGVVDEDGEPVSWLADAEREGAMVKACEDVWLRM